MQRCKPEPTAGLGTRGTRSPVCAINSLIRQFTRPDPPKELHVSAEKPESGRAVDKPLKHRYKIGHTVDLPPRLPCFRGEFAENSLLSAKLNLASDRRRPGPGSCTAYPA